MLDAWMGAEDSTTVTTPPVRLELKAIHCALLGLVSVRLGRLPELAERARMPFSEYKRRRLRRHTHTFDCLLMSF